MPSFEKVCAAVFEDPAFIRKALIGGALVYLPFINILVMGYGYRYARQIRESGDVTLPEWNDLRGLCVDGVRMLALTLLYAVVPMGIAWLLYASTAGLFNLMHLYLFADTLAFIPVTLALAVIPPLLVAAVYHYQGYEDFQVLRFFPTTVRPVLKAGPVVVLPVLALWGVCLIGWPLIGFAFFLGFNLLLAYLTLTFMHGGRRQY